MPLKYFMILILVGSFVMACSEDSDNPSAPQIQFSSENAIIPLAAGNYWITKITRDANGEVTVSNDTGVVTGPSEINGAQWFTLGSKGNPNGQAFRNTPEGTALWAKNTESLMFKYPAEAGDSLLALTGGGLVTVTVLSIDEIVTTPAGTFTCYKYYWEDPASNETFTYYLAPRIGIVKSEYHNEITNNPYYPDGYLETAVGEVIAYHLEN